MNWKELFGDPEENFSEEITCPKCGHRVDKTDVIDTNCDEDSGLYIDTCVGVCSVCGARCTWDDYFHFTNRSDCVII